MRVRRDSTSRVTSLIILAFSLGERVVNHLARRCSSKSRKKSVGGFSRLQDRSDSRVGDETHHFALAGEQDQVAGESVIASK